MGTVSFGWAYSLSPRTQIGINGQGSRIFSQVQDQYTSTAGVSLGRTMSQHWFVQGQLGWDISRISDSWLRGRRVCNIPRAAVSDISSGRKRCLGRLAVLSGIRTDSAPAPQIQPQPDGTWQVPGSSWSVSATYNYQQLNGSAAFADASWRAVGGISRQLIAHISVSANYTYFNLPPTFSRVNGMEGAQSGVMMSLFWSPSTRR